MAHETHTHAPEAHTNTAEAQKQKADIRGLDPLMSHMDKDLLEDLDSLQIKFQETDEAAYDNAYNRIARDKPHLSMAERRKRASREALREATGAISNDIRDIVNDLMAGVPKDDPHYDDREQELLETLEMVANIPAAEWDGDDDHEGLYDALKSKAEKNTTPRMETTDNETDDEEESSDPEAERLNTELKELKGKRKEARDKKRAASVALQLLPLWKHKERAAAAEEFEAAVQEYKEAVAAYQEKRHELQLHEGMTAEQANASLIAKVNEWAQKDFVAEKKALIKEGGFFARQLERYGKLSTKKKIAVGLGLAATAGVIGFTLGAVGVAGGVVTATAVAGRVARGYALGVSRIYSTDPLPGEQFHGTVDGGRVGTVSLAELGAEYIEQRSKESVAQTEKARKRAIAVTIGTVALGSLAGEALAHVVEGPGEHIDRAIVPGGSEPETQFDNPFDKPNGPTAPEVTPVTPEAPEVPETPSAADRLSAAIKGNARLEQLVSQNLDAKGNLTIPVRSGDGFIRLSERYGLDRAQMRELIRVVQENHPDETYMEGNDPRLNLGDRKLVLSSREVIRVLSADKATSLTS